MVDKETARGRGVGRRARAGWRVAGCRASLRAGQPAMCSPAVRGGRAGASAAGTEEDTAAAARVATCSGLIFARAAIAFPFSLDVRIAASPTSTCEGTGTGCPRGSPTGGGGVVLDVELRS